MNYATRKAFYQQIALFWRRRRALFLRNDLHLPAADVGGDGPFDVVPPATDWGVAIALDRARFLWSGGQHDPEDQAYPKD